MKSAERNEIWIAEDNHDVCLMLDRAFKRSHPSVRPIFFHDGLTLVESFRKNHARPKLLLLDLQMPIMTGLEALGALLAEGGFTDIPVVIFSSSEHPDNIRAAYASGAKIYLKKPSRLEGYGEIAKLCAKCADHIRDLPASAVPFGALDVARVLKLLE